MRQCTAREDEGKGILSAAALCEETLLVVGVIGGPARTGRPVLIFYFISCLCDFIIIVKYKLSTPNKDQHAVEIRLFPIPILDLWNYTRVHRAVSSS